MSGLEKFQANSAWREKLKRALLAERKIAPQLTDRIKESERFSLDISGDFSVVLEEKKIPKKMDTQNTMEQVVTKQQQEKETAEKTGTSNEGNTTIPLNSVDDCHWQPTSDESFEVIERMCNKTASDPNSTLFQYLNSDHKEEIVEVAKKRNKSDGEGECCEKGYDAEARALKRLLDQLRLEEQIQLENESPLKGVDETALEDVEPPSKLWETTVTNETILKTSPIKMVGLLRPSTIIEECDTEDISFSSDILTHETNTNVSKTTLHSEVSSSCYETAKDSTTNSESTTGNKASETFSKLNAQEKQQSEELTNECDKEKSYLLPEIQITEATLNANLSDLIDHAQQPNRNTPESSILDETEVNMSDKNIKNKEEDIINKQVESDSSESDVSIIEIFSEDDSDENNKNNKFNRNIKCENVSLAETNSIISSNSNKEKEKNELQKSANENDNDIEMISKCSYERKCPESPEYDLNKKALTGLKKKDGNEEQEEGKEREYRTKSYECNSYSSSLIRSCSPDLDSYDNKENCIDFDKSLDKSLNFNDTLEEVEYMMKKGAQYLATSKKSPLVKKSPVATRTAPLTPLRAIKQNREQGNSPSLLKNSRMSPSPNLQKQKTPLTASRGKTKLAKTTPKSAERSNQIKQKTPSNPSCGLEMKPFPKLDLFKKPTTLTSAASHKRPNELTNTTKQFSHIVSPIRAYINNSTNTPLMTTINNVNKNPNSLNSLHELERESRLYKPNFVGTNEKIQIKTDGPCHLPKKAYISSEFKCIVDKRTPITIPGGSQYQKHIEIAMLPAVLKHEGKMKKPQRFFSNDLKDIPSKSAATTSRPNAQRAGNESVGDLSLASGDISMYTIKDARKF